MKKEFRTKNLLSESALNPKFVVVNDCVVLAGAPVDLLTKNGPISAEDRQYAEYAINRRDIWELFEVPPPEPSPRLLLEAGNTIREIWQAKLGLEFPDRRFVVCFEYAPPVTDISFFQALPWHIQAEADSKATWRSRSGWRPRLVVSPLVPPKKRSE